jgi:hypothetical protein
VHTLFRITSRHPRPMAGGQEKADVERRLDERREIRG